MLHMPAAFDEAAYGMLGLHKLPTAPGYGDARREEVLKTS
jgi:hypothetical protein